MSRIREILIGRSQRGWVCELTFTVRTARQFTDEWHSVRDGSKSFLIAIAKSWFAMRRDVNEHAAKPGERKTKGWV